QIMRQKDSWQIKLAIFFNNLRENGLAYADFITNLAKGDLRTITCPGDSTKPASGGISYGFNSGLIAPISSYNYGRIDPSVVLIADCDGATFAGVGQISSDRHIKYTFAGSSSSGLAITRGGNLGRSKTWSVTQRGFLGRRITVTTGVINDINDANITYTTTITYN
ncbi:MAG: hypothetical protein KKE64_00215, partial [Candidatus Omnitrophica bacterium]|nr:hypothetical protein [Candidatus Omnitrophota bacterium]